MNKETLDYCKSKLLALKSEYSSVLKRPMSGTGSKSIDKLDVARNESQIHRSAYFRSKMKEKLCAIEGALRAIENGSYGRCIVTGAPIADSRLRALPWTRVSIDVLDD